MSFKFHFISADSPILLEINGVKYKEINKNYNELSLKTVSKILKKKEIKKYFNYKGNFFLQLLPAYIHNYIKIFLKISDIVKSNNLEITGPGIIDQAIKDNVIMGSVKKYWLGDLDFIMNLLKRKLSQNKIKLKKINTDTLFLTLPKNIKNDNDTEFGEIIKYFNLKKKHTMIVEPPYYSDRSSAFSFKKIKVLKKQNESIIHWDRFENFSAFFSAIYTRISLGKFKFQKLSNDYLENFLFNTIIKWAYTILLPYDFNYISKTAENLLKNISCQNICLTYEHGPYAKLLMNAAQKKKIKCYAFIHGYLLVEKESDYSNIPIPRLKDRYCHKPLKTFVYNSLQKKSLIQNSIYNKSDIKIVGNWKMSSIYKEKKIKYNFCFFDSYNQIVLHELILNALKSLEIDINKIYYRPHPNQSEEQSKKNWITSGGLEKNILTKEKFSSLEIISKTKLGLFDFSSTIMEAAENGVEILYTNINSKFLNKNLPFKNHFRNSSELKKKIIEWSKGTSFFFSKSTIKKFNFSDNNNKALNRIYKEIYHCK